MIIDAHAHAARDYSTAESILDTTRKYGIERIVLCTSPKNNLDLKDPPNLPFMNSPDSIFTLNRMLRFAYKSFIKDHGDGNKYVFELRNKLPDMILQFLWVNPLDPKHMTDLERNIEYYQVKGIKLHQAWNPFSIDGVEFKSIVEIAKRHALPVFIHLYSKKETRKLLEFIGENQDVIFIIGHMLGLDIFKEKQNELPNIYFDTSGSRRVRGKDIQDAITLFGHDHVVFGSDTPYARIEDQIAKINGLNLPDDVKEHIFRLNILNVLS
ncbi:MAG TPA: TatD family hydrolase [Candidatus Lokiarchaeia archaeon]|nr:TatD family hydrolase [Candidatus Lokiarchaeia archaeon]